MTKEELTKKIFREFKSSQVVLINFNIYLNTEHIDYYIKFNIGDYQWCYDYLIKNKNLLTIKNTPNGKKTVAKKMINQAKTFKY